jgi:hypothetical protein
MADTPASKNTVNLGEDSQAALTPGQHQMVSRLTNSMEEYLNRPKIKKKRETMDSKAFFEMVREKFSSLYSLSEHNFYQVFNKKDDISSSGIREAVVSLQKTLRENQAATDEYREVYKTKTALEDKRFEFENNSHTDKEGNNANQDIIDNITQEINKCRAYMKVFEDHLATLNGDMAGRSRRLFERILRGDDLSGLQALIQSLDKVSQGGSLHNNTVAFSNSIARSRGLNDYVVPESQK